MVPRLTSMPLAEPFKGADELLDGASAGLERAPVGPLGTPSCQTEKLTHEQMKVGLSNAVVTAFGLIVRWATSRIVRNVPSVPLKRR